MDLEKLLKEFNKIEPDPDYTRRSRLAILGFHERDPKRTAWGLIWSSIKFSTGTVITGLVIILIFVAFSVVEFSSPVSLTALDPITLRAEAEAIDIQIKLTALGYENPSILINQTTTLTTILNIAPDDEVRVNLESGETQKPEEGTAADDRGEAGTEELTLDETLEKLAE